MPAILGHGMFCEATLMALLSIVKTETTGFYFSSSNENSRSVLPNSWNRLILWFERIFPHFPVMKALWFTESLYMKEVNFASNIP